MIFIFSLLDSVDKHTDQRYTEICDTKFWKYLTIAKFPSIRASMFKLVHTMCTKAPNLLEPHLKTVSPLILGSFSEKEHIVHTAMMETMILFIKKFPECWKYVKADQAVFSRLRAFLKNPETSSPNITFQYLLPYLSYLNYEVSRCNSKLNPVDIRK